MLVTFARLSALRALRIIHKLPQIKKFIDSFHTTIFFSMSVCVCVWVSVSKNVLNVFQTCEFGKINENSTENKCKNRKNNVLIIFTIILNEYIFDSL